MEPCLFRHGKTVIFLLMNLRKCKLQWSHVFSDMVRLQSTNCTDRRITASMEPCLFRHGKPASLESREAAQTSFNGAMSFQTW
ncbi:protein of unknown function [Methanoculleus bourgensis]|uniref:Uncharacterized protein n=1 Tax=Methanoculleus bourgensis TaxID=83986 RepID=A0A110BK87_9EURY|nr:protein of unknown function [Methanoculleus bourgensis]